MPLYEYCCNKCGAEFEEMASSSATTTPACPQCASGDTKKLMSACRTRTGGGLLDIRGDETKGVVRHGVPCSVGGESRPNPCSQTAAR